MLQDAGFLPKEWDAAAANKVDRAFAARVVGKPEAEWTETDCHWASPFAMRAHGLDNPLEPHEFGRVILHLHRRRGFRSNRGAKYLDLLRELGRSDMDPTADDRSEGMAGESKEDKDERKRVLGGIQELDKAMSARGSRTVGEHVWKLARESQDAPARITTSAVHFARKEGGKTPDGMEKVAFYARRDMTETEFDLVCKKQMGSGLAGLNNAMRNKICKAVFEQFPVQSPPPPSRRLKHLRYNAVGECALEPGRRRADAAALASQEFRTWAVVNNIVLKRTAKSRRPNCGGRCLTPARTRRNSTTRAA